MCDEQRYRRTLEQQSFYREITGRGGVFRFRMGNASDAESERERVEREARGKYSAEACRAVERVIRVHKLCDDGVLIAWKSARMVEDAIDAATTRRMEEFVDRLAERSK